MSLTRRLEAQPIRPRRTASGRVRATSATLALLGLCGLGATAAHAQTWRAQRSAIVNGRVASEAELNATVAITDAAVEDSFCTGTLIAPRVVVTAAHCVVIEDEETQEVQGVTAASDFRVVAGSTDALNADDSMIFTVSRVVVHPGYPNESASSDPSGANRYDDVALLLLDRAVGTLTPATIPSIDDALAAFQSGAPVTISGFGITSASGEDTGVLHIAETTFETRENAEIVLGRPGEPDTCPGDSGGPAYLIDGDDVWLVGITSRSAETAQALCGEGGIYAFAPFYRGWFADNANGLYVADGDNTDPGAGGDGGDGAGGDGGDDGFDDEDDGFDDEDYEDDEGCSATGTAPGVSLLFGLPILMLGLRRRRRG